MTPRLIAGPCAAESELQLFETARQLKEELTCRNLSLSFFRAGVWKPRSNPNSFSGVGEPALQWLSEIQKQFGFNACVEVLSANQIELCEKYDIHSVWIGARTAVNPTDVQKIADAVKNKPFTVLVKNPIVPDLKLWAGNIERFQKANVKEVMAVHRGFADSSENVYRNAPCWEIPIDLKVQYPDLQILCDPSHLCGDTQWIPQIAQIALNYGFNGLMLECHCHPEEALSDGNQQLLPQQWGELISSLVFKSNVPNHDLVKQRALLENIDTQLSTLLQKRMDIVDVISQIKKANNLPVVQPQQWQQVCDRYLNDSLDGEYQNFIKQFLEILHQASIKRQK